jgi:hypothetical protein
VLGWLERQESSGIGMVWLYPSLLAFSFTFGGSGLIAHGKIPMVMLTVYISGRPKCIGNSTHHDGGFSG